MRTLKQTNVATPQLSPMEIEDRKRAAQAIHERIVQTLDSMKKARQSVIQICAESIGVPQEVNINRVIWHGIVRYANADVTNSTGLGEAFLAFHAFSTLCVMRLEDSLAITHLSDLLFRDLESLAVEETFDAFYHVSCQQLLALHQQFRLMLTWLADPNGCLPAQKEQSLDFLLKHGGEGAIEFTLHANDEFDDTGNEGAPFFYWKNVHGYRTILSPAAKFILDQLEQYQADEERARLTLGEAIPLILCKRPACSSFAILRRRTMDFCSASCRTLYRQETKREEHAAYQRRYRANCKKHTLR